MTTVRGQKVVARERLPRVQITYDVELDGYLAIVQLPFVIGVLANLSGASAAAVRPVASREFVSIRADIFEAKLKELRPRLTFQIPNRLTGRGDLTIDLVVQRMTDFAPAGIINSVWALRDMFTVRQQLFGAARLVRDRTERAVVDSNGALDTAGRALRELGVPDSENPRNEVRGHDTEEAIARLVSWIDQRLEEQINLVLHHDEFRALEATWRGLHYLVSNTDTDEMLEIRVMDASKYELGAVLEAHLAAGVEQCPISKENATRDSVVGRRVPFGCLIVDYYFDHSPSDVALLRDLAAMSVAAHAPLVAGAAPSVMGMRTWGELAKVADIAPIFSGVQYAEWHSLRETDNARYIFLTMPRYLARRPYGSKTNPVAEFGFEEETNDHRCYVWANAAYLVGANLSRAFSLYGWLARTRGIESGGSVENLPTHTFLADDGKLDTSSPAEIAIGYRLEAELANCGFMPLMHVPNSELSAFIGARSIHEPAVYKKPEETVNANLAARLPYILVCCRFAQYVECVAREITKSATDRTKLQRRLQEWIMNYIDGDPWRSSQTTKAMRPLASAEVLVNEVHADADLSTADLLLRPHYQFDGSAPTLRMVVKVPTPQRH